MPAIGARRRHDGRPSYKPGLRAWVISLRRPGNAPPATACVAARDEAWFLNADRMNAQTPLLMSELRRCTRAHHAAIEAQLALDELRGLERYGAILCGFDAFMRPWETAVRRALPARLQPWFDARRRAPLLRADLVHLGLKTPTPLEQRGAQAVAALPLESLAQALGAMYVIEGSALGGQVIAPRLQRVLGLAAGRGASYFHGFGDQAGPMWRQFRETAVAELGDEPAAVRSACAAAAACFDALISVFAIEPASVAARPVEPAAAQP